MRSRVKKVLVACLLVLAMPVQAAFERDQLKQLVEAGRHAEAYEYARQYVLSNEGEPEFDFWFGVAALDSGNVSEGVFALDRVILLNPKDDRARLELARGYYLLEEDVRARQEFETVLSHNPPDKVRANIKLYLDRIRIREESYKNTAKAYMEFGMGYDTNINSAPADATFTSPLFGTLSLNDASLEEGERFAELLFGGQVTHPFERGSNLTFGFNAASRKHFDSDDFETEQLSAFVSVTVRDEEDTWKITGQLQEFEVAEDDNRTLYGLTGEWTRRLNEVRRVAVAAQVAQFHYPDQSLRDASLYTLAGSLTERLNDDVIVFGSVFVGHEDSHTGTAQARAATDRIFLGARAGGIWRLTNILSLNGSALYQYSDYSAENILLGDTREDDMFVLSAGAKFLLSDKWSMKLDVSYTDNDSTLAINKYDRTTYRLGMRYDF